MTYEESNEVLKRVMGCKESRFGDYCKQKRTCLGCKYEYDDEEFKEALKFALEALEKQIPKKPHKATNDNEEFVKYECPVCGGFLIINYPCKCGQMINWG